ncbi:hypothetical protein RAM19_05605 [Bartonella apihabitans]|nr:hypothetical protein [Bartonella apihabitans]WLT09605.1 hypothetical protein RAM19_05605 [Bartonella apihabitans]
MVIQRQGAFARDFGISPFSVLNAREGWWQKRKKQWLWLGIESQKGRGENLLFSKETSAFLTKEGKQALIARRGE